VGVVAGAPDRGGDLSARPEGRIETAVGVVADQGEVVVDADERIAGRRELPDGLEDQCGDAVVVAADRSGDLAAGAEGRIEAAVGVVADDREVGGDAVVPRRARGDQLPVGLEDEGGCTGGVDPDRGAGRSTRAEGRIEAAVGVVADEGEGRLADVRSGRNQLPVGLEGECVYVRRAGPERGGRLATRTESRVEAARRSARCGGGNERRDQGGGYTYHAHRGLPQLSCRTGFSTQVGRDPGSVDLLQQLPCGVRRAGPSFQFVCRAAGSVAGAATAPHLRRSRRNVDACRTAPIRTYGLDGGCSLGRRAWT